MKPCIESLQNPKVKHVLRLRESRFRRRSGQIVIDGIREIGVALKSGVAIETIFYDVGRSLDQPGANDWPKGLLQPVTEPVLEKISYGDRKCGAIAVAQQPGLSIQELHLRLPTDPLILVLDRAEKPGNIGAVVRTAATAGASAVLLVEPSCEVFNPNAIRASLGTIFSMPLAVTCLPDLADWLMHQSIRLVRACVDGSTSMWETDLTGPLAIALGSEAFGLGSEWQRADWPAVQIPMKAGADSLNLSVSAAVLCYEAIRQRKAH